MQRPCRICGDELEQVARRFLCILPAVGVATFKYRRDLLMKRDTADVEVDKSRARNLDLVDEPVLRQVFDNLCSRIAMFVAKSP